jgi:hypothetical protein
MRRNKCQILIGMCLLTTSLVHAETYYVSPTGTASWAQCTGIGTPCNGRTAVENAVAGDLVYFRGGTYDPAANPVASWSSTPDSLKWEQLPWNPGNSGTATAPITFKAYPGEIPVFLDNIYGGALGAVGRNYITWDGFTGTIANSVGTGLEVIAFAYFQDATGCVFRNGNISGVLKDSHHNAGLITLLRTTNTLIENNRLHDMNNDPGGSSELAVNAAAILSFNSTGLVVKNNDIYNNYLGVWDKDTESNNRYYQNHIWGGSTAQTRCHVGIQIREGIVRLGQPDNPQAYQNVIRNCDVGAWVSYDDTRINSAKIYNNVVFHDSGVGAEAGVLVSEGSAGAEIYNNIIHGYPYPLMYFAPLATTVAYSNRNLFHHASAMSWSVGYYATTYASLGSWRTATGFDVDSIQANPQFVTAGGTTPADFRLATGSPAIGGGRNGVDMGAYPTAMSPSIGSSVLRPKPPVLHP